MTDSSPDDWLDAYPIVDHAKSLPAGARAEYIASACRGRSGVAAAVEKILARVESSSEWGRGGALDPQDAIGDLVGATVGEYEIAAKLGDGGMGAVYLARQGNPQRDVALKLLRARWQDPDHQRRFEKEIKVLASLSHAYIARLYSCGIWERRGGISVPYYAMEFVAGARDIVRYCREDGLDRRRRIELLCQVLAAVDHGHAHGVVHRDLKPDNILVDAGGLPRVIDFGIARITGTDAVETRATIDGGFVGTLPYMAPEQHDKDLGPISARTDVYALGLILYELLCDRPAIELRTQTLPMRLDELRKFEPSLPSRVRPETPQDLDRIFRKAVMRTPADRYERASSLKQDLEDHLGRCPLRLAPRIQGSRSRRALALGATGMGLLAVGIVLGQSWTAAAQSGPENPIEPAPSVEVDFAALLRADAKPTVIAGSGELRVDLPPLRDFAVVHGLVLGRGVIRIQDGILQVKTPGDQDVALRVTMGLGESGTVELTHARLAVARCTAIVTKPGSHSRLIVGHGSVLHTGLDYESGRWFAMGGGGDAELKIINGGKVGADDILSIGDGDHGGRPGRTHAVVSGQGSELGTWHLRIGRNQDGSLAVVDGGVARVVHSVLLGMEPGRRGVLELRGGQIEITHPHGAKAQVLIIGQHGSGLVEMTDGSLFRLAGPAILAQEPGSVGRLVIRQSDLSAKELQLAPGHGASAHVDVQGSKSGLHVDSLQTSPAGSESGIAITDGGRILVRTPMDISSTCRLSIRGGTLQCSRVLCAGLVQATDANIEGDLRVTGSMTVAPGSLRIRGAFECAPDGLVELAPGGHSDPTIRVFGAARLAGVLRVRLLTPATGVSIPLIQAESIEGAFAHVVLDPQLRSARIVSDSTTISLVVE